MSEIERLSYLTVAVGDQDEALAWYTTKMGFVVNADLKGPGIRWLTISPPRQPDLQIVLASWYPDLVGKGAPIGLLTSDCQATWESWAAQGVVFSQPPQKRPFGLEAVAKDLYGNTWAIRQVT